MSDELPTPPNEQFLDKEISRLAREAYRKFASEPLVKRCGGVDRASYCAGFDEGYRAAIGLESKP